MRIRIFAIIVALASIFGAFFAQPQRAQAGEWRSTVGVHPQVVVQGDTVAAGIGATMAAWSEFWIQPDGQPNPPSCGETSPGTVWCISGLNAVSCKGFSLLANMHCNAGGVYFCSSGEIKLSDGKCGPAPKTCRGGCCSSGSGGGGSDGSSTDGAARAGGAETTRRPIEISTGRKLGTYVDWSSGGVRPLQFIRYYNSRYRLVGADNYTMLGNGWRTNFDSRALYKLTGTNPTPFTAATGNTAHFALPDGTEIAFKKAATAGLWQLVAPTAGTGNTVLWTTLRTDIDFALTVTSTEVTLRAPDNTRYVYDFAGLLTRIEFKDGYRQFFSYNGKRLANVTDSFGRAMTFDFGTNVSTSGLLQTASLSDGQKLKFTYVSRFVPPPGLVLPPSYTQNTELGLASVIYPDATPLTDTDNPKKTFEYLNDYKYPYSLTGIFDENGTRYLTVTYDSTGRALSSELNGGAEKETLVFDDVNNKVTVTNALGRSTTYTYSLTAGNLQQLTSVDGIATTNCAASNTAYLYDANGFRSQATDAEGRITAWVRNSRGLPTTTTEGSGTPQAVATTTAWDATKPLPTSITRPGLTTTMAYNTSDLVTSITQTDTTSTTVPYSTNGQVRTTTFNYTPYTQPQPPTVGPTGTALADLPLTLVNPNAGAGAGALTGWTIISGGASAYTIATTTPCSAANPCFKAAASGANLILRQDVAVPAAATADVDAGRRAASLSWTKQDSGTNPKSSVRLQYLNASGGVLGSLISPVIQETGSWFTKANTGPVPPLTRTIRIEMLSLGLSSYIDDVAVTLTANGTASATPYLTIANPDGLAGGTTGWTVTGGIVNALTSDCVPGFSPYMFPCFADSTASPASATQDIAITSDRLAEIDNKARRVEIEWLAKSKTQTFAYSNISLQFLDAANAVIANSAASADSAFVDILAFNKMAVDVPANTRKIRLTINTNTLGSDFGAFVTGLKAKLIARTMPSTPMQLLTSVDGPLAGTADSVTYQYDTAGNLSQITNEVGLVTQIIAVNSRNQPTTIRDPNLVDTNLAYNERGWLTSVTVNPGASQALTAITYDAVGQITKITTPDGSFLQYTWTPARKVATVVNNAGEKIEYGYNLNNSLTSSTVKTSGGTITKQMTMVYDEIGRLLRAVGAATQTTSYAYDRSNLQTQVTDPRNNLYAYAYDSLSRLIRETNQENAQVNYTLNGKGERTAYADPRTITTTYTRNGFGEAIQEASPDAGTTVFQRDARGLVTQATDGRGVVTNRTYDNAGRLLTEAYPAAVAENVTYAYDSIVSGNKGKGRMTSVTDQSGSTSFTYDALGRVTTETRVIAGKSYGVTYAYNAAGRVSQITYPSGRQVLVARNANGQVTDVTTKQTSASAAVNVATGISWKPLSQLVAGLTHGNGLATNASYNTDYRLTQLQLVNGAATVSGYAYSYTDGINLTGIVDQVTAGNSNALSYTPANRLASATGAWGTSSYSYDSVGNRLTDVTGSITNASTVATTSNRLTGMTQNAAALRTYSYDGAGNITQDIRPGAETFLYSYNNRNRLASVTRNGVAYGTYIYNALEQLASRNTGSAPGGPVGTVHYIYDRDGHLIAEADGATGATLREYIWLPANDNTSASGNDTLAEGMGLAANDNAAPDLPLALVDGVNTTPVTYQVHTDHLGRPIRMTDAAKATVWQAIYKPWGEVQSITGTVANTLRFPGQYFQIETNLAYNWHRHYDPVTGRYTQPDPLRFVDGSSVYQYAQDKPMMITDRLGLATTNGELPHSPMPKKDDTQTCQLVPADCTEEHLACAALCARASTDSNMPRIWAGRFGKCMRGCVSFRCGGNGI